MAARKNHCRPTGPVRLQGRYLRHILQRPHNNQRHDSPERRAASLSQLVADLDAIVAHLPATVPLLGLTELRIWASAKQQDRPIWEVFLAIVAANLAALD